MLSQHLNVYPYNYPQMRIIFAWLDFTVIGISRSRYLRIFESLTKLLCFLSNRFYFLWALALDKSN